MKKKEKEEIISSRDDEGIFRKIWRNIIFPLKVPWILGEALQESLREGNESERFTAKLGVVVIAFIIISGAFFDKEISRFYTVLLFMYFLFYVIFS